MLEVSSVQRHRIPSTDEDRSHGSWSKRIREYSRELLLCLRGMYFVLLDRCLLLLPVRDQSSCFWASTDLLRSETRHKTLEEIAAAFGDRVVSLSDSDLIRDQGISKGGSDHKDIEVGK